jgi:terminase large subunit-like protein
MTPDDWLRIALDPAQILVQAGMTPDPWQRQVLQSGAPVQILNCSRQSGKSTVTAAKAVHTALFQPESLILILSPGQRQSIEFFRKTKDIFNLIGRPFQALTENQTTLELENHSRIVCLPGKEATVRSYSKVALLIIDEASRVGDDLYKAVRPMLAVSSGKLIMLSTPFGRRGFFYREWTYNASANKIQVDWTQCPRISPEFISSETISLGQSWVDQEYRCCFTTMHGLVYPDFEMAKTFVWLPPALGYLKGGIDWGFRNPFAAIWGVYDNDDCLWIQDERYLRETSLTDHAEALPKNVIWHADPAGATEINAFRRANHVVHKAYKDIRLGIQAVTARLRTGRLKINAHRCPNLCAEAQMYRYPVTDNERAAHGENPVDSDNHAMDALRYLICGIDRNYLAKLRNPATIAPIKPEPEPRTPSWLERDEIWTRL